MAKKLSFDAYLGWVNISDPNNIPADARVIGASDLLRYEKFGKEAAEKINSIETTASDEGLAALLLAGQESKTGAAFNQAVEASSAERIRNMLSIGQMDRQGQAALAAYGAAASKRLAGRTDLGGMVINSGPADNSDTWRIQLPPKYDPSVPTPLVMLLHNSGGSANNLYTDVRSKAFLTALSNAGYIIASADSSGSSWANNVSRAQYVDLYEYVRDRYAVSGVVFVGVSMGGTQALNMLARPEIPNVLAYVGIAAVASLRNLWTHGYSTQIREAFGIAPDGSDFDSKTAGFRPEDRQGWEFRGVPIMLIHSPDDKTCLMSEAEALAAKATPYSPQVKLIRSSGAHMAEPQFADTITHGIPFIQKYAPVAAAASPAPNLGPNPMTTVARSWLASGLTTGTAVASWKDTIKGVTVAQPVEARRPIVGVEGNTKYVRFDGVDDFLDNETDPRVAAETVAMVMRIYKPVTGGKRYFGSGFTSTATRVFGLASSLDNYIANAGTAFSPSPAIAPTAEWAVVLVAFNGASSVISVNGREAVGNTGTAVPPLGWRMATTASDPTGASGATGIDIIAQYSWDTALNGAQREVVVQSLQALIPK